MQRTKTVPFIGSKLGTGQGRREGHDHLGRPPDDRWYGLTDFAGITLSGHAERAGYDLASGGLQELADAGMMRNGSTVRYQA